MWMAAVIVQLAMWVSSARLNVRLGHMVSTAVDSVPVRMEPLATLLMAGALAQQDMQDHCVIKVVCADVAVL